MAVQRPVAELEELTGCSNRGEVWPVGTHRTLTCNPPTAIDFKTLDRHNPCLDLYLYESGDDDGKRVPLGRRR